MIKDKYALIRVSTSEQNEARQVIRMNKLGISKKNMVIEKESGKSKNRVKYHSLIKRLNSGDTLYIENIDRLGRDYDGIIKEWANLTRKRGIILKVLDTPILNSDELENNLLDRFTKDILLRILAFQAESEWHKIKERQAQGIAVAKAEGKNIGRPKSTKTAKQIRIAKQYLNHEIDLDTALTLLKIKKTAFYSLCGAIKGGGD